MADVISAEDQALIDAAIAKGKVQRIPTGVSNTGTTYRWNGTNLESVEPNKASWRGAAKHRRTKGYISPQVAQRRIKVSDLIQQGMSAAEVAKKFGVSEETIRGDAKVLGLEIKKVAKRKTPKTPDRVLEKRAQVKAAFDGKKTASDIARELGMKPRTVASQLEALGLEAPKGRAGQSPASRKEMRERRDQVRQLVEQGLNQTEIAERLGVSSVTISEDCKAMGVQTVRRRRRNAAEIAMSEKVAERRAQIPGLIQEGLSGPEIAERLNASVTAIRTDVKLLGLKLPRRPRRKKPVQPKKKLPNLWAAMSRLPDGIRADLEKALAADLAA